MGQPIEITRLELSASDLRMLAAKTGDGGWVRRLLAIALLLDGHSREAAAVANGMTRQTLRDWVHRFNADGVTGLRSRTSPGRPPALNDTHCPLRRRVNRSRFGSKTKPGWGRKEPWNISGRPLARARERCEITATTRFICLAHSVRIARLAPPSSCLPPTAKP